MHQSTHEDDLRTHERLKTLMRYCGLTGKFFRIASYGRWLAGQECGWLDRHGHVRVMLDGKTYGAHRLAMFYVNGEWPSGEVDHINGIRDDNRLENLRIVSHRVNLQNRRVATKANRSGVLGVTKRGNSHMASIKIDGKTRYLGSFPSAAEAHAVYLSAKRISHEGCTL